MTRPGVPPGSKTCPACGQPLELVEVHGHGQCAACGTNVVPCCTGAGQEADAGERGGLATLPDLLAVLEEGGGTLQRDDLLNRFAQVTGCTWEDGEALLRAGVHRGVLTHGPDDLVALSR